MAKSSKRKMRRVTSRSRKGVRACGPRKSSRKGRKSSSKSRGNSRIFKAKGSGWCAVKNGQMKGCDLTKAEAKKKAGL